MRQIIFLGDDFYRFSCGGYMDTKTIADYEQMTNNYVESNYKILNFLLSKNLIFLLISS